MGYKECCLKLVSIVMVTTAVCPAEWNGSNDYDPPQSASNCDQGYECLSCAANKTGSVVLSSGYSVKVCCPGCSSRYFKYGSDSDTGHPFCRCQYEAIGGSVWKGEECNVTGMTTYGSYGEMPLCCPDPLVMVEKESNGSKLIVDCEKRGNCWRGSMCANCTGNGAVNGVPLCCPNCERMGKTIIVGDVIGCSCLKRHEYHTEYEYGDDEKN